jgi:hypothetical protein
MKTLPAGFALRAKPQDEVSPKDRQESKILYAFGIIFNNLFLIFYL